MRRPAHRPRTYPSWGYMVEKGATTTWETGGGIGVLHGFRSLFLQNEHGQIRRRTRSPRAWTIQGWGRS
ncbi:hypothetical protein ABZV93_18155 [Actinopolymorpha sp. NPDC004070]|uniref:alpha-L-rhamnosidase-related protein n=1 Tax=Actinopolymorpha sp. NPDC004070 TaxID=3154548 RepID=UPI0033A548B5